MLKDRKIGKLEKKIERLEKSCKEYEQQLTVHENLIIKTSRIIKKMDKTMGPICQYYIDQLNKDEKNKLEEIKDMYR